MNENGPFWPKWDLARKNDLCDRVLLNSLDDSQKLAPWPGGPNEKINRLFDRRGLIKKHIGRTVPYTGLNPALHYEAKGSTHLLSQWFDPNACYG